MNELSQTVIGKDADEVEARAKEAVAAYFGTLDGIEWEVVAEARTRIDGSVLMYEGRVYARRETGVSEDLRSALLALAERWEREAAASDDDEYTDRSDAYRDCAEAVLALLGDTP